MFHHEALLYDGPDESPRRRAAVHPGGLERGRAGPRRARRGQDRGSATRSAERADFVDMRALGRNPARIIPAWRDFRGATPARCAASASRSGPGAAAPSWSSASCTRRCSTSRSTGGRVLAAVPVRHLRARRQRDPRGLRRPPHVNARPAPPTVTRSGCWRRSSRRCAPAGPRAGAGLRARHARGRAPHDRGCGPAWAPTGRIWCWRSPSWRPTASATAAAAASCASGTTTAGDREIRDRGRIEDPLAGRTSPPRADRRPRAVDRQRGL